MTMRSATRITLLATVAFAMMQAGTVKAQPPQLCPVRVGPSIGISADAFAMNTPAGTIEGVRVLRDHRRRSLYKPNGNGGWQRFQFRPRYDVILDVNGASVRSASDVRHATQLGWNQLRVWDQATGNTATYWVHLD